MNLNVQELLSRGQPVRLQGELSLTELFRDTRDVAPMSPLTYDITAIASEGEIVVSGELSARLKLLCSRCLNPVDEELRFSIEEHFRVVKDSDPEPDEDDDFIPVKGEKIALVPFLEEELVIRLPLAPLCREDCKGLCPSCGTNRNEQEACGCKTEAIDPRLAMLQDWFKPDKA